jgi:hypothetical protein
MKKILCAIVLGLSPAVLHAAKPEALVVHKVLIAALGRDASRATDIEASIKTRFIQRGVTADAMHTVLSSTSSVVKLYEDIQSGAYDSVLCMAPRATIRIKSPTAELPTLESCLKTFTTGKMPSGESLEVNPYNTDGARTIPSTGPDPLNSPIHTNPNAAHFHLSKGTLRLYEVSSGKLLWEKEVRAKVPDGTRMSIENDLIIYNIWDAIDKSGFLPTKP